jgi:hypothetical protein
LRRAGYLAVLFTLGLSCSAQVATSSKESERGPVVAAPASLSAGGEATTGEPLELGAAARAVDAAPDPAASDTLPTEGALGVIDRAGLVLIIDAGLGRLFQRVKVAAELDGGKFVGFRIVSIDQAWAAAPLSPGDVIRRVNGQPIERPEQAMAAF